MQVSLLLTVLIFAHLADLGHGYSTAAPYTTPQSSDCGSVVNNILRSPGYPNYYPNNKDCFYRVPIPSEKELKIIFNYFSLESASSCRYDYLRITNDASQTIGTYCGTRTGQIVRVTGSYAEFSFHSDGSVRSGGYELFLSYVTSPRVSCNFDYGLCPGWRQSYSDVFDWTRRSGSTPSSSTGPSSDHTSGSGYYMYIETSPRSYGDNAKLEFSVPSSDVGKGSCLTFYYHMYGATINTLNVYNGNSIVFTKSRQQGYQWFKAKLALTLQNKITFEGISGSSYTGDIAIDDVTFTNGTCRDCKEVSNLPFRRLYIRYSDQFDPHCSWIITNTELAQPVAVIWIERTYLGDCSRSEYVKVFNGNGTQVFVRQGCGSNSILGTFLEIPFGESRNVTIQVSLVSASSYVKLDYGTLNKSLNSASHLPGWNITVVNRTSTSFALGWRDLANQLSGGVRFYIAVVSKANGSLTSRKLSNPNATSTVMTGLSTYTEYNISVLAISGDGRPLKSENILAMTDEGVPSRAPYLSRVISVSFSSDLMVYWYPISPNYVNGRLLGYCIYYRYRQSYYSWSSYESVNISSHNATYLKLTNLKPGQQYRVSVAAFTSKGVGPRSNEYYATTGCSTTLNMTFGEIDFNVSSSYYVRCYWKIQTAGVNQAVALISVKELNLQYCSEFVNITNGNGTDVLYHQGCLPFATENLLDVQFGRSKNIYIQTFLRSSQSSIKVKFGILKQGISSALTVSGWNVTVLDAVATSFTLQWTSLYTKTNRVASFYVILIKSTEGSVLAVEMVSGSILSVTVNGLKPSARYRVGLYGIDGVGQSYKSQENLASTTKVFCGSKPSGSRIVGGSPARFHSWPWQVKIVYSGSDSPFCGGSLVYPHWVVTAAHCVNGRSPSSIKVKAGAHFRTSGSVGTEQELAVAKIIPHENYNRPLTYSNDIALLQLVNPAILGVGVGLVCLPDISHPLPFDNLSKKCWITGWGTLSSGGSFPNSLMEARVPLVSKGRCDIAYPGKIDKTMLCAGLDEGGVDTCQGDSGGPLVCDFNSTWYLEGVTSWGYRCAYARKYGVYGNVRNLKAWVSEKIYQVAPPNPPSQNQSVSALVWCYFNNGLCSGWNQTSSDDFDWTLSSGATPSSSTGPSSGQGGSGKYVYIETSSPRKPGENAKLVVTVPKNGRPACLSFYYHMYGATVGTLNVYSGSTKLVNISGNQGNYWKMMERNIYLDSTVTFEGIVGISYTGDIAIDSVKISDGKCPVLCDFDQGLCLGWSQSTSDVFDWTLRSGSTPSSSTGPSSGHGGSGKYMYTEASSPRSRGDNAKLQLAVPNTKSTCCLVFYYHMYGSNMGTLNVFSGNNKIFSKSGNQGNYWKKVVRTVRSADMLTFEGITGSSFESDIAIDDVLLSDGNCPGCGGVLNQSSGELSKESGGDEGELSCNWTIGDAGISQAVAIITLQRVYLRYCSEHLKIRKADGTEVFYQQGCRSSLPYGTVLEIPFEPGSHFSLDVSLEYRWSAVSIKYNILKDGFNSAEPVSWNITVFSITSSSARVQWPSFPLSFFVSYYFVRYKEDSNGVSRLFRVSGYSNTHYTSLLRGYTAYDVQVFAVTTNKGNSTYASNTVSFQTPEGVPSQAPTNVKVENHRLDEFLVQWDPVPQEYINGRLLGYKVYYKRTGYYYTERVVNTNNSDVTRVILPNIQIGQRYQISASAFTSRGQGPRSSYIYSTKGCEGFVNQSFGWLNLTHSNYNTLNCSILIHSAGSNQGIVLIAFQYIYLPYCNEFIKIYSSDGTEVFSRRGCDSLSRGLTLEIPFAGGDSIRLAVLLSYRYSSARIQYTVLDKSLSSAQVLPSWNITVTSMTPTSLTIRWQDFPLNLSLHRFLVKYKEKNINLTMVFQVSKWYNTHYSGSVLKGYQFYEVQVIAVTTASGNGTNMYSTKATLARTSEGVPSIAPSNVRVTSLHFGELKIQWNPIPQQYIHGRLQGYRVYYTEYPYWYGSKTVNSSSPDDIMLVVTGLKVAHRYRISVAAFTSVGTGPRSSNVYITTGCGGYVNQSFGQLHIGSNRGSSYLSCNFVILNVGISQAVSLVWIQDLYISYYSEYIRITDGNGTLVYSRRGYSSSIRQPFLQVDFGRRDSINFQISLTRSYSRFKLQYGIVKQGLGSALPVSNWNVTIVSTRTTGITITWQNVAPLINERVLYYIALIGNYNGSILDEVVVSGNKSLANFVALSPYTGYQVRVVGVGRSGQGYNSSAIAAWTDEGVPSRAPSYIRLSNLQPGEVKVQWSHLAQQYANGRLLGYTVYYQEYTYPYLTKSVNTSSGNDHMVILRRLKAVQRYRVRVAAFTLKGVGPSSSWFYITTACGGSLNQSFGHLQVGRRSYYSSYLRCTWAIGNAGISQAVAFVSLQELYLSYSSEYIKIIDGNGFIVLSRYGYSSAPQKPFFEVRFGNSGNITVQIYLRRYYSVFKLQFGIFKQGLQSAIPVANWTASIENTTTTSIRISWQNLTPVLGRRILHYFVVIKSSNGSILNGNIRSENTFSDVFYGLSPYREYRLNVIGVDEEGRAYNGSELVAWTEEGVPSRSPSNISITDVRSTRITVHWSPLLPQYHNGRLLGYKVYFRKNAYYSNPVASNGSSTTSYNPYATNVTLTGLDPGQRYDVSVSAFTSKGEGTRSSRYYVTTACRVTVNQSVGLIHVTQADYSSLYCSWTIGNAGITDAVAIFIIETINLNYCSEYLKIFDGNGILQYNQNGCSSFNRGSIVQVSFMNSSNITTNIYLNRRRSSVKILFVLRTGFSSAPLLSGWNVTVHNTTFSSLFVQWTNLTNILNRQVLHYIVLLNRNNGSALANKVARGNQLTTEITGLRHSTNYTLEVFGIDGLGNPYRTTEVDTRTKNMSCGSRPSGARIVGGSIAPQNSWPWQAMIRTGSGRQFCGGSLIHPQWVLTATHCVTGKSLPDIKVRLGAHYRLSASIGTEQDFDVTHKIQHESYYIPNRWSNDVALLKLSRPATLGKGVGLVCLSDTHFQLPFDTNETCWITGWGTLYYYGPQPSELMQVALPLVSQQRCLTSYPGKLDSSMICVGRRQGGVGACHGDSGGPLVCEFNSKWYLEGVASWTGLPCGAPLKPTVYANVRYLKSWIISKVNNNLLPTTQVPTTQPTGAGCGSVANNRLRSPGYPSSYPSNMDCSYRVSIPYGKQLNIYFLYFHLESSSSCRYDYLRITNNRYQTIGTYCGVRTGQTVRVTGSYAMIYFHSDGSVQYSGYDLSFSYVTSASSTVHPYTTQAPNTSPQPNSCGSVVNNVLRSPRYPSDYPNSMYCVYRVSIPYDKVLKIYFNYFRLESHSSCGFDYLKIMNDKNHTIGAYCGSQTGKIVYVNGSHAVISFRSDGSVQYRGYELFLSFSSRSDITSCNFDSGLCPAWRQSYSDVFDWTRHSGPTSSSGTGPSSDHTSGSGYYMYTETSSPRGKGDNAKLVVSVPGYGELACLTFYYHMYGAAMGSLIVFSGNTAVFSASGDQGNYWRRATRTIRLQYTVTFEGVAGSSFTSDIAIDDVSITNGSCLGSTAFPTTTSQRPPSSVLPWTSSTKSPPPSLPTWTSPSEKPSTAATTLPSGPSPSPEGCSDKINCTVSGNFCMDYVNFTREFCPKTCGFCEVPTVPPVQCADTILCPPHLAHSYCANNFDWSMANCPKTCGFCGGTPEPSKPTPAPQTPSDPSTYTPTAQTPSVEEKKESVMLRVRGLNINKWDQKMEDEFKTEVARAATDYCVKSESKCQSAPLSSRRRRSSDMAFSPEMVHILPGYPKQSDDPAVAMLAFYLSLPEGLSKTTVVNKDVLMDIVKSDMSSIEESMDSTIVSVDPVSQKLEKGSEDDENEGESKPTKVIIGASIGGVLFFVVIAALLVGCKRSNRFSRRGGNSVESNESVGSQPSTARNSNRSIKENGDNIVPMEEAVEMEKVGTPPLYGNKPDGNAKSSEHSEYRPTEYLHSSDIQDHPESFVNRIYQGTDEVENVNHGEEKSAEIKQGNEAAGEAVDAPASLQQEKEANTDHHKKEHHDTHDYEEVHSDTHDYEEVLNSAKNSADHRQSNVGQCEDTNVVIV